jgi:hypothetical protein
MPYALAIVAAGTIGVAAFQNQNQRPLPQNDPGHPTPPYVIVTNHGAQEAIPVTFGGHVSVGIDAGSIVQTLHLPQPWLYRSITLRPNEDASGVLNTWGNDGWEAVGVTSSTPQGTVILMKRPQNAPANPGRGSH